MKAIKISLFRLNTKLYFVLSNNMKNIYCLTSSIGLWKIISDPVYHSHKTQNKNLCPGKNETSQDEKIDQTPPRLTSA